MPRTKGSKNLTVDERIAAMEQRVDTLRDELASTDAELASLE